MLKDEGIDSQGGPCYSKYERCRVETIWRERLKKDADLRAAAEASGSGSGGFQMNLANLYASSGLLSLKYSHNRIELITEKEHAQAPASRTSLEGMDPESFEVGAIKHLAKKPTEKWDMPALTSHDVGWLLASPVRSKTLRDRTRGRTLAASGARWSTSSASDLAAPEPFSFAMPTSKRAMQRTRSAPGLPTSPNMDEVGVLNNRKWFRPKGSSDVTKYAECYVASLHHNPFNQSAAGR